MLSSSKKRRRGQLYTRKRKLFTLQPCSTRQRNLPKRAIRCIRSQYCKRRVFVLLRNRFFFTFSLPSLCQFADKLPNSKSASTCFARALLEYNSLPADVPRERAWCARLRKINSKLQRTQGRMTNVLFLFFYSFVTYFQRNKNECGVFCLHSDTLNCLADCLYN